MVCTCLLPKDLIFSVHNCYMYLKAAMHVRHCDRVWSTDNLRDENSEHLLWSGKGCTEGFFLVDINNKLCCQDFI